MKLCITANLKKKKRIKHKKQRKQESIVQTEGHSTTKYNT